MPNRNDVQPVPNNFGLRRQVFGFVDRASLLLVRITSGVVVLRLNLERLGTSYEYYERRVFARNGARNKQQPPITRRSALRALSNAVAESAIIIDFAWPIASSKAA